MVMMVTFISSAFYLKFMTGPRSRSAIEFHTVN